MGNHQALQVKGSSLFLNVSWAMDVREDDLHVVWLGDFIAVLFAVLHSLSLCSQSVVP